MLTKDNEMTINIHICDRSKHDVLRSIKYDYDGTLLIYAEMKRLATESCAEMEGLEFNKDAYEGMLAEHIFKYFWTQLGRTYEETGFIYHENKKFDRGDMIIPYKDKTGVATLDIKTSSKHHNVAFYPRKDIEIDYAIGTHIQYDESKVDLYVYGAMRYRDYWKYDIKPHKPYCVIPPSAFRPLRGLL